MRQILYTIFYRELLSISHVHRSRENQFNPKIARWMPMSGFSIADKPKTKIRESNIYPHAFHSFSELLFICA